MTINDPQFVAALRRVVDERGTVDDWRIVTAYSRALGNEAVTNAAQSMALVLKKERYGVTSQRVRPAKGATIPRKV